MAARSPRQKGLFGGYMPEPRDPRGRKRIVWDAQAAQIIAVLAADGSTQEDIAEAVSLSVKTLVRIYADELRRGGDLIRQAVLATQVQKAVAGNTTAANFVFRELDRDQLAGKAYQPRKGRAPAAVKLGKKEQRQLDAQEGAAGMFAPGAPPAALTH